MHGTAAQRRPPRAIIHIEPSETLILSSKCVCEIGTSTVHCTPQGTDAERSTEATYLTTFLKTGDGCKAYREVISANGPTPGAQ